MEVGVGEMRGGAVVIVGVVAGREVENVVAGGEVVRVVLAHGEV